MKWIIAFAILLCLPFSMAATEVYQEFADSDGTFYDSGYTFWQENYTNTTNLVSAKLVVRHGTLAAYNITLPDICRAQSPVRVGVVAGPTIGSHVVWSRPYCADDVGPINSTSGNWQYIGVEDFTNAIFGNSGPWGNNTPGDGNWSTFGEAKGAGWQVITVNPNDERRVYELGMYLTYDENATNATNVTTYGTIKTEGYIGNGLGGFTGPISIDENFGISVVAIGDIDDDGVTDIAIGEERDPTYGSVWILRMNSDGSVKAETKLTPPVAASFFGERMAAPGDLDGDGVEDLMVLGGYKIFTFFLDTDGSYKSYVITDDSSDRLESWYDAELGVIGDLDNDGVVDICAGDADFGNITEVTGRIIIYYMNPNGTYKSYVTVANQSYNGLGLLHGDSFGNGCDGLGDLDGDGIPDIVVGANQRPWTGGGAPGDDSGSVFILFMNRNGTVKDHQIINNYEGNMNTAIQSSSQFGDSVKAIGDLDEDGVMDIVVGANFDNDGNMSEPGTFGRFGAVYIIFLTTEGTVKDSQKISNSNGNLFDTLHKYDEFGISVDGLGDFNGDGIDDIIVGAPHDVRFNPDPEWVPDYGRVYILYLEGVEETITPASSGGGGAAWPEEPILAIVPVELEYNIFEEFWLLFQRLLREGLTQENLGDLWDWAVQNAIVVILIIGGVGVLGYQAKEKFSNKPKTKKRKRR